MNQWIAEIQSVADASLELASRCRRIVAKTEANGLYLEPAPAGSDVNIAAIRTVYDNIVKDMVNMFGNAAVGKTDRTTMAWLINRGKGV
jgi:hypothetical protein